MLVSDGGPYATLLSASKVTKYMYSKLDDQRLLKVNGHCKKQLERDATRVNFSLESVMFIGYFCRQR